MKPFLQSARRLLAAALLLAAGCATTNDAPPLPENYSGALAQIQKWAPVGTPAAEAKKIMQQHGFKCTLERDTRLSAEQVVDDIYCELVWPATPNASLTQRRWQAFLILSNDKVSNIMVATGLVGR